MVEPKGDQDHTNRIVFETGAERDFINLSESYLEVKRQVGCTAGSIVAGYNLALTNLYAHGLWQKVTLTDKSFRALCNPDNKRYGYQAMLLTLLSKNQNWASCGAGRLEG